MPEPLCGCNGNEESFLFTGKVTYSNIPRSHIFNSKKCFFQLLLNFAKNGCFCNRIIMIFRDFNDSSFMLLQRSENTFNVNHFKDTFSCFLFGFLRCNERFKITVKKVGTFFTEAC